MRFLILTLIVVSCIGFIDAVYLTAEHYSGGSVVCQIGEHALGDCDSVLSSSYATVAGIPVALGGSIYYFALLVLAAFFLTAHRRELLLAIIATSGVGFLATLWFVYLQLFVLSAICLYCMVSALATTTVFITSLVAQKKLQQEQLAPAV